MAQSGFLSYALVLQGSWLGIIVYAFDKGGLSEAGLVTFGVLLPAAFSGPFVAVAFDRLPPRFGFAAGLAGQALFLLFVAIAAHRDSRPMIVYGLMALYTIVQMSSRPTLSAILPKIVRDPAELTAANALVGVNETLGLVLGPATAGLVLLIFGNPSAVFFISAGALTVGAGLGLFITDAGLVSDLDEGSEVSSVVSEVREGVRILRNDSRPRHLVTLMATHRLLAGAMEIGVVVIAIDQLGRDESTAGLLGAVLGVGAVVGAALTVLLVGRRRLSMPLSLSLLLASLPVALIAIAAESLPLVLVLLALAGLGRPVMEVAGRTLLQGLSSEDTLTNVFGLLEGVSLLLLAVGSVAFSQVTVLAGREAALIGFGVFPVLVLAALYRKIRLIDAARPEIDVELLKLVRGIPIFAPLPAFGAEQMLSSMTVTDFDPEGSVFSAGDDGDRFYVVESGTAILELEAGQIEAARGAFFGEIALLTGQPRMASVRAGPGGLRVYTLSRDGFLSAINAAPKSKRRADVVAARRLEER